MTILRFLDHLCLIIILSWSIWEGLFSRKKWGIRALRTLLLGMLAIASLITMFDMPAGFLFHAAIAALCIRHAWTVELYARLYQLFYKKLPNRRQIKDRRNENGFV